MKSLSLYIVLCLVGLGLFGQKANPVAGVAYVKLAPTESTSSSRRSAPTFSLSDQEILNYTPLRKRSTTLRQSSSVLDGLYKIEVSKQKDILAFCNELEAYGNVIYAEPVFQEKQLYIPNDPSAGNGDQDYLEIINAYDAWNISRGDSTIVIGIIDSGIDFTHEDIDDKIILNEADPINGIDDDNNGYIDDYRGYDFADEDNDPQADKSFHGNRVGGVAAAETDNEIGIAGVGFHSKIAALKIFRSADNFSGGSYEAIVYAADLGYDVINLSWGSMDSYNQAAQDIITYAAVEKDVVIVAAAGNTPGNNRFYPASYDHVLSVAASNNDDSKAGFTSYNYDVDLMAPGSNIYSTFKDNGYATDQGTSYSAPMVAGAAALVRHIYPELNALQVMERIRSTSHPVYDVTPNADFEGMLGYGRLDMFQALSADSVKAVRVSDFSYSNGSGPNAFYGDSITFAFKLTNYLMPTSDLRLRFSSSSEYVSFIKDEITIGNMEMLGEQFITEKLFALAENTPSRHSITVKMEIQDGNYSDSHYFELTTNSDLVELSNGEVSVSLTSDGNIGYVNEGFSEGNGMIYENHIVAANMGVLFSTDGQHVSDNLPGPSTSRDRDFIAINPIKLTARESADHLAISTFSDDSSAAAIGITVDQRTIINDASSYLIYEYRVINTGESTIDSLRGALYMDWRLKNTNLNHCYFDSTTHRLIGLTSDSSLFAGMEYFQTTPGAYQALDLGGSNPDVAFFNDSIKHSLTYQTQFDSAGSDAGNDVAALLASPTVSLAPATDVKMTFLVAIGKSPSDLKTQLDNARNAYSTFRQSPPVLEYFTSCSGASLEIDPASGDLFRFYSDPNREHFLEENDTLHTGEITSDTVFYAVNIDNYPTEVQKLVVQLVDDVADFKISTDTLYLDHDVNRVQFTDLSFEANTWTWDFGNGIQSSIQNPAVNYSEPGTYSITLTVTNDQGCTGTLSKTLHVANRPAKPVIEAPSVCAGEEVTIVASNTDHIALYTDLQQTNPIISGAELTVGPLSSDTVLYFTNLQNGYESLKQEVSLNITTIKASFTYLPNPNSTAHEALFIATATNATNSTWVLEGNTHHKDTLIIEATPDPFQIQLIASNKTGCSDTLQRTINFRKSPTPTLPASIDVCPEDSVTIVPEGGSAFGFYADAALTRLLQKGNTMTLTSTAADTLLYVVGLDSILPSDPVMVAIGLHDTAFDIALDPDTLILSQQQTITLSSQGVELAQIAWYLDSIFLDTHPSPKVFFDQEGDYTVSAVAKTIHGCSVTAQKKLVVRNDLSQEDPLSSSLGQTVIYPNPTQNTLTIQVNEPTKATLFTLDGQKINSWDINDLAKINLSQLQKGVYLLVLDAPASGTLQLQKIILTN
ncbi:S8 family serine peptidase [Marinoscillum furvescens]|uniref:Putative secreted protein (Por secretion system target) n=1 Tax=Marinoscillum furvescens DSM 4134 TaxID=1122208 RepID=A0A3D9L8R2_MARFU|nr:S8 family serine peptidase [Marinoscillum furvescens]REE02074.1 putative secreted protein (Por secretion system target) [Marinoscillum furvescens DSM 4134]